MSRAQRLDIVSAVQQGAAEVFVETQVGNVFRFWCEGENETRRLLIGNARDLIGCSPELFSHRFPMDTVTDAQVTTTVAVGSPLAITGTLYGTIQQITRLSHDESIRSSPLAIRYYKMLHSPRVMRALMPGEAIREHTIVTALADLPVPQPATLPGQALPLVILAGTEGVVDFGGESACQIAPSLVPVTWICNHADIPASILSPREFVGVAG